MIAITDTSGYSNVDIVQANTALVIPTETEIQNLIGSSDFINTAITTAFKGLLAQISNETISPITGFYLKPSEIVTKVSQMFNTIGFDLNNGNLTFQALPQAFDWGTKFIIDFLHDLTSFKDKARNAFVNIYNDWGLKANNIRALGNSGFQKLYYIGVYDNSNLSQGQSPENEINLLNKKDENSERFLLINLDENSDPEMPAVRIFNNSNVSLKLRVKIQYEKYVNSSSNDRGGFGPPVPFDSDGDGVNDTNIYLNRRFLDYFPNAENSDNDEVGVLTVNIAAQSYWDIDYDERIRGGEVKIEFVEGSETWGQGEVSNFTFYIRGENPTYQQILTYLDEENYYPDRFWFLVRKIRQESLSFGSLYVTNETGDGKMLQDHDSDYEFRQFNPLEDNNYTTRKNTYRGLPNFGAPRGFGLGQIDNIGTATVAQVPVPPPVGETIEVEITENGTQVNRTIDFARYKVATDQEVWHWKKNIDRGVWFLANEKMIITKNKIINIRSAVMNWNNQHPTDLVTVPSPVQYSTIAYAWVDSQIEVLQNYNNLFDEGIPPNFTNPDNLEIKSFFDAMLLKSYNGNTGGFFMDLGTPLPNGKPVIQINETNNINPYYVRKLSNRSD